MTILSDQISAVDDNSHLERAQGKDEWDMPTFAFHDLDYIPSGYSGILAPYIETGPGTMRAAAKLMRLDRTPYPNLPATPRVICDCGYSLSYYSPSWPVSGIASRSFPPKTCLIKALKEVTLTQTPLLVGCGDGEFLISLLRHITQIAPLTTSGFGIDYNASFIATAALNAVTAGEKAHWLVYDFNLDENDLFGQMGKRGVTHLFVYLVPKQLALKTVRTLLVRLCESGVVICCHKFQPACLRDWRAEEDSVMDLVVYECGKVVRLD